jgi:purine-binding chemotaxis protein CheW
MKTQHNELTNRLQVVKFRIAAIPYAIDIYSVREIIYFREAIPLPEAPPFIKGVLDLRGTVIPIIDLRTKMGVDVTPGVNPDHILVLQVGNVGVGMVVDEVLEVLQIQENELQSPQKIHKGPGSRYLAGVVKRNDEMVFVLDLDRLLTTNEKASISGIDQ